MTGAERIGVEFVRHVVDIALEADRFVERVRGQQSPVIKLGATTPGELRFAVYALRAIRPLPPRLLRTIWSVVQIVPLWRGASEGRSPTRSPDSATPLDGRSSIFATAIHAQETNISHFGVMRTARSKSRPAA